MATKDPWCYDGIPVIDWLPTVTVMLRENGKVTSSNEEPLATMKPKFVEEKIQPAPTTDESEQTKDYVESPNHYEIFPDVYVIEIIRDVLTPEEFQGFCKGNILKYRLRDKQDREEDYAKSQKYQEYMQNPESI